MSTSYFVDKIENKEITFYKAMIGYKMHHVLKEYLKINPFLLQNQNNFKSQINAQYLH